MKNIYLAMLLMAIGLVGFAPAAEAASSSTNQFIRQATVGNGFEILSSRLALQRSRDPEIRDFARHMIEAHQDADEQLRNTIMASRYRMQRMPNDLDAMHRAKLRQLENAEGREFDRLYVKMQADGHRDAVKLYRRYAQSGQNPRLREFAENTLPTIEEHQEHVQDLRFNR